MPVVSGPAATTRAAGLAGPSSTTAACSGPTTSGGVSRVPSSAGSAVA
ncbi:MAG: hypothetical protein JOY82_03695 [Streptosporangiaceae bacterium]|nr:hypothetical protein [Streptosporangiaceae bacterium]MBV9853616.1 hypothetical protein [Streptosporangiaceae bacterium]